MLTTGQELWLVPSQRYLGQPRFVTVTKVGRKWADISERGYRVELATLVVHGGTHSVGRCYVDRAAYEAERYRQECWSALKEHVDHKWNVPSNIVLEQIRVAAMALGVELPPER